MQRYLDIVERGTNSDEFDAFLTVVALSIANPSSTTPDVDYTDKLGITMEARAASIGRLLYEAGRVNESANFDPTALFTVLGTAVVAPATAPYLGAARSKAATTAVKSLLAMWYGVDGSTRAADTDFEGDRYENQALLAIGVITSVGGPAAERLGELAAEYPDPQALLDHLDDARTNEVALASDPDAPPHEDEPIAEYVDIFVDVINNRSENLSGNDG